MLEQPCSEKNVEDLSKTLLLIDGSSYLYRAYHALPNLRGPQGEPTGAIYGVVNMLKRLQKENKASYGVCIFDAKGKNFRHALYPEYKANRSATPEDLAQQIEPIQAIVSALGWPVLVIPDVEADDVIGTLAEQAVAKKMQVIISTGDKDMAQLVNEHISLINTMTDEVLVRDKVIEKFGVPPELIVDYLCLIGDTVDNVPGIHKVGPKTAVKWLQEYGNLETIIQKAADIKGAVGENLRRDLDRLPLNRQLLTISRHCELGENFQGLEALTLQPKNQEALLTFFKRYGFKTWVSELQKELQLEGGGSPIDAPLKRQTNYETILTWAQFNQWFTRIQTAELTSIDTETDSLDFAKAQLVGISLAVTPGEAAYIPLAHRGLDFPAQLPRDEVLAKLKPWLESDQYKKLGQHIKYDEHIFANYGICLGGIAHDTLLQSYVLESHRSHGMDDLAKRHLGMQTIKYEEVCGKGAKQITFDQVPLKEATDYAAEDADITLQLHHHLYPQLAKEPGLTFIYEKIELPVTRVLQKMERSGVLIDSERLLAQSHALGHRMMALEAQAYELAGRPFNLNSPKQIAEIFFTQLKLPIVKKTPGGEPSTDEEVLQKLAENYPLPQRLLEYRSLSKLKSTYTDKLPQMINAKTGRVHTHYAQAVAVTGRLSSSEPNLQNIPIRTEEGRRIREAFIAPSGYHIVSADYSQIELRIMAHLSEDLGLLEAFSKHQDIHQATAAEIFNISPEHITSEQRRYAKTINFGLIYGMSVFGLAANLGIERDAAKFYMDRYFSRYPGVARYMEETRERARQAGYVETIFGRRLWLPEITGGSGPRRQAAERAAINAPMQGSAADLIKLSMIAVQNWLEHEKLTSRLILQVHDELVLEVAAQELDLIKEKLPQLMRDVAALKVPLIAELGVGQTWGEAH